MPPKGTKKYTPRQLMELAVIEGENSIPEHHRKEDPFVGAILATKDGEVLAKAHRGELRVGEHCEFTLIERKLLDRDLSGCLLYITLEPCTDESRGPGKHGCASHIVAARINTVYVGIEDPNPKIARSGIKHLISKNVVVHTFEPDLQDRIRLRNAEFIREQEEQAKAVEAVKKEEERTILEKAKPGTSIAGLSEDAVHAFIEKSKLPYSYPSVEFNNWALDYGLLEKDAADGEPRPTGLGMMLFGRRPSLAYSQCVFRVEIRYPNGNPEIRDFESPLVFQLPEIIDYVKDKALQLTYDTKQAERREHEDFPIEVIREAVANAIIHRDYAIEGATNYLYIDSERIVVKSPGEVAPPLSLEDLRELKASWYSRNPKIMFVFNQMQLAEQRGRGIRKMKELPSWGFPLPTFEMQGGCLVVTFTRSRTAIKKPGKGGLSEQEYQELLYIQANEPITREQFAKQFNLPSKTAINHLNRLIKLMVVFSGRKGKATRYYYKKS
jgi:ATP-dependent DNA helicase RecG